MLPREAAIQHLKTSIRETYVRKGEAVAASPREPGRKALADKLPLLEAERSSIAVFETSSAQA